MNGETFADIILICLVGFFLCYLVYTPIRFIVEEVRNGRDSYILSHGSDPVLRNEFEKYLLGHFKYYDKLSDEQRIKFLVRIRKFLRYKKFESRGDIEVTKEIKVLVAAAGVQLTFGLENYVLDHFSLIIIYPDSYYSPITKQYHQGEANPKGVIVISWKDFLKGYDIPNDTYNVGLHEMAHALELEKLLAGDSDAYFDAYYQKWKEVTAEEYEKVSEEKESFLRSYAGTNRHEFFSVCVEQFFEASEDFRSRLPDIYHQLCKLLNQDPLNKDYIVEETKPKSYKEIEAEILSSVRIYETRYSPFSLFLRSAALLFIFILFAINNKVFSGMVLTISFSVIVAIPSLFFIKKIALYEKYITVENSFGKLKAAYPLNDVVSISFYEGRYGNSITILTAVHGKILKYTYFYNVRSGDIETMEKLLKERNVVVHESVL